MVLICRDLKNEYQIENLCLSGGVALNCVANGKLIKEKIFKNLWIQPAAGDAGGSLGASLAYWYNNLGSKRELEDHNIDNMSGSYLGPEHSNLEIEETLNNCSAIYDKYDDENLIKITADLLSKGEPLVGFRAEWNLVLVHSAVDQLLLIQIKNAKKFKFKSKI